MNEAVKTNWRLYVMIGLFVVAVFFGFNNKAEALTCTVPGYREPYVWGYGLNCVIDVGGGSGPGDCQLTPYTGCTSCGYPIVCYTASAYGACNVSSQTCAADGWTGAVSCSGGLAYQNYQAAYCTGGGTTGSCGYTNTSTHNPAYDYTCDTTWPDLFVSPTMPANTWYYDATPFSYTATWSDSGSGLQWCRLYKDLTWYSLPCSGASYTYSEYRAAGNTSLFIDASDIAGNYSITQWYNYGINPPAVLTSPANNSPLAASSQNFIWNQIPGASGYAIWLGTAPGGYDLGGSGSWQTGSSQTFNNLPTNGSNIYVRLWTLINGQYLNHYNDYTFSTVISPGVNLLANSVANSITIPYNTAATLTWSATNATSCTGTGFSTGGATSGSVSTGNLYGTKTYTISCTGPGGTAGSSVTVHILPVYGTCSGNSCVLNTGIENVTYPNLCSANCTSASYCGGSGGGGATGPNWHSVCANNACVVVNGAGTNECSTNLNCGGSSYPAQYYGVCAQGACVMVSGTSDYCATKGVSSCSNYGGTCPNPAGSSYNISSSNDLKLNITKQTGTVTSNNTTLIIVEPLSGFSDTVNLSVNDWGGLVSYSPTANFSRTSLTSSQYSSGATLSVSVPIAVPSNNYFITVRGTGAASGKVIDRTIKVILHNAATSTWLER